MLQIDTGAGEQTCLLCGHDPLIHKDLLVFHVLKKDDLCALRPQLIQEGYNRPKQTLSLEGGAKPGNVDCIGDVTEPACKPTIYVGLDGICNHQIRLLFFQNPAVLKEQLQICNRIDAPPVNRSINEFTALGFQRLHHFSVWKREHHRIFIPQCANQLPPELV